MTLSDSIPSSPVLVYALRASFAPGQTAPFVQPAPLSTTVCDVLSPAFELLRAILPCRDLQLIMAQSPRMCARLLQAAKLCLCNMWYMPLHTRCIQSFQQDLASCYQST